MKILKLAFQNFFRNFWLSLTSIIIILLMIFVLTFLYSINALGNQALQNISDKMDLGIYFKENINQNILNEMIAELESCPEVKEIEYLNSADSLIKFKERHQEDTLILKSLEELGENPLGSSLSLKLIDPTKHQTTLAIVGQEKYQEIIHNQNFYDYQELIALFNNFNNKIYHLGLVVSGIFLIITILVIFTAIKMGAISRQKEIKIMRLVGASSSFIRAPFLIEGSLYALTAWLLNLALIWPLSLFIQPQINNFLQIDFDLFYFLRFQSLQFWIILLIFSILISMMASFLAVNKYART
ncbi:permease-like cell division protein FtsX [Patescibacteria group bacterium]|nr:permease-like cell division protein FtsX [Patescibacteria group bacterium]